jgi:nanoRNase/pAp phosphatase (c-di-AMP/oligoRNAs hydrolase)
MDTHSDNASAQKQFLSSLKEATNVMVTVKSDPSIDGLAAAIALTLMLNGLGKHATAVFSGAVPSVLEFLEPEKTLEVNTNSLQDFIISLDKSKADKLRYKVEDDVVKIYITPYRTSLTAEDLEFAPGDFNVDVVVLLGVHAESELDAAVSAHGRILHDATLLSLNVGTREDDGKDALGAINWTDEHVSSLSELITGVSGELLGDKGDVLDNQVATALLTGIIAATDRFGNARTTPATMQAAAKLLEAGANQELVSTKLSSGGNETHTAAAMAVEADTKDFAEDVGGTPVIAHEDDTKTESDADVTTESDDSTAAVEAEAGALSLQHTEGEEPAIEASEDLPVSHDNVPEHDAEQEQAIAPMAAPLEAAPEQPEPAEPIEQAAQVEQAELQAPAVAPQPEASAEGISDVHHTELASVPDLDMATAAVADAAEQARPSYDMNQISVPATIPISEGEQQAIERASTPEEEALTAMLRQNGPVATPQAEGVQPLRDQNVFLGEPPLHEKTRNPLALSKDGAVDPNIDATKFAITPPQMGGTLTASHDDRTLDPATDPLTAPQSAHIIRHRSLMTQGSSPTPGLGMPAPGSDAPTDSSAPGNDAPHSPGQIAAPTGPDPTKKVTMAHERVLSVPTHEDEAPAQTAAPLAPAPGGETLSELERLLGTQHEDTPHDGPRQALQAALAVADAEAASPGMAPPASAMPQLQSMDMPFPQTTPGGQMPQLTGMPAPQVTMPTVAPQMTTPPAPPPMPTFGGPAA